MVESTQIKMPQELEIVQENTDSLAKVMVPHSTVPTSFEFVTFTDMHGMRDGPAKSQIRKHAMKDIGVSRRRPRRRRTDSKDLPLRPVASMERSVPVTNNSVEITPKLLVSDESGGQVLLTRPRFAVLAPKDHFPVIADRALYDPCVRTMSCKLDPLGRSP